MHDTEQFEKIPFGVVNDYTNLFHASKNDKFLNQLRTRADKEHVSVVTPNVARLLEILVTLHQPKCILELGTAFGVSAYHILKGLQSSARFITIDLVNERQEIAKKFLHNEGLDEHQIVFKCEDFREKEYFANLAAEYGLFDFVFIDAAKGQYSLILETLMPLTTDNAVIVFDNIFLNGWIIENSYPNHRQKTAFIRMKQFLQDIKMDKRFINALLSFDDGVLVLIKKQEQSNETEY